MKIRTVVSVKHDRKLHTPGTELDVKDEAGKALIAACHAEKILVEPAKKAGPEPKEDGK
ncbi:hypothetical protein [Azospirillum canadense]|uniref:hypothetical protein n=1 Tax=Azospirillum canadense TaxID=403962 RepID=UPI0022268AEF|nr:hypothetical protein [Azospirillum canadense]MCW2242801.1 hypothetical protein [Azospirillum canadense]